MNKRELASLQRHLQQVVERAEKGIEKARKADNPEYLSLFERVLEENRKFLARLNELCGTAEAPKAEAEAAPPSEAPKTGTATAQQVATDEAEDVVELESMESFPASDSPTHY